VLGEPLRGGMGVGLVLIAASFAVLVAGTSRKWVRVTFPAAADRGSAPWKSNLTPFTPGRFGYVFGVVSALGYSSGYLLRKMGLEDAHDALLGAAVGCAVGAALFLVTAAFRADYARAVRATFAHPNAWLIGAGVMSSFGQILYFAALNESPMSRVALISSMEVFVTLFLGYVFLSKRERLTPALIVAAILGVAGTAFVFGY